MPESYFDRIAREAIARELERKKKGIPIKRPSYSLNYILQEKMEPGSFDIKQIRGHYEVYRNNQFYCSADTYSEALKEIPN